MKMRIKMNCKFALAILCTVISLVESFMEVPKFSQMLLLYPGYHHYGGRYRDVPLLDMISDNNRTLQQFLDTLHNTASLRLSWALNRYGGRHAIGTDPVYLSRRGRDSFTGRDGQEYIFRNTAFGPFLAAKYGNPEVVAPDKLDHTRTMLPYTGRQGIVRLVSYRKQRPSGHVSLWDCDHFHQSRDWTTEHHIISVEFWEAPDSHCPPETESPPPLPRMEEPDMEGQQIVPLHTHQGEKKHQHGSPPSSSSTAGGTTSKSGRSRTRPRIRHHKDRDDPSFTGFWIQ